MSSTCSINPQCSSERSGNTVRPGSNPLFTLWMAILSACSLLVSCCFCLLCWLFGMALSDRHQDSIHKRNWKIQWALNKKKNHMAKHTCLIVITQEVSIPQEISLVVKKSRNKMVQLKWPTTPWKPWAEEISHSQPHHWSLFVNLAH